MLAFAALALAACGSDEPRSTPAAPQPPARRTRPRSRTAPSRVQLAVHPTWDQHGDIVGSGLAAAAKVGGTLELLATAGVKRGVDSPARALQYAARYCRP